MILTAALTLLSAFHINSYFGTSINFKNIIYIIFLYLLLVFLVECLCILPLFSARELCKITFFRQIFHRPLQFQGVNDMVNSTDGNGVMLRCHLLFITQEYCTAEGKWIQSTSENRIDLKQNKGVMTYERTEGNQNCG